VARAHTEEIPSEPAARIKRERQRLLHDRRERPGVSGRERKSVEKELRTGSALLCGRPNCDTWSCGSRSQMRTSVDMKREQLPGRRFLLASETSGIRDPTLRRERRASVDLSGTLVQERRWEPKTRVAAWNFAHRRQDTTYGQRATIKNRR
jgi:hypothetical protein